MQRHLTLVTHELIDFRHDTGCTLRALPTGQHGDSLQITASAISLNVADVTKSADFAKRHFGFEEVMAADGFVSLAREDAGFNLIFLSTSLPTFKPASMRGHSADGLLIAFVVDNIDEEYARIQAEGVAITTPIETEEWGERYFQVTDPNGVVLQLVQWMTEPA